MDRFVENVNVYDHDGAELRKIGQGVTHYRAPWRDEINGEGLRHELVKAGLPDYIRVFHRPDTLEVEVVIPGDDKGKFASKIDRVLDKHKGTEAKDHKALIEFAGSVREAARRMAEGGQVSAEERDIVTGILAGRLV